MCLPWGRDYEIMSEVLGLSRKGQSAARSQMVEENVRLRV